MDIEKIVREITAEVLKEVQGGASQAAQASPSKP